MFPFPSKPVRPDAQGRYPWTFWRTTDVVCAALSFLVAGWLWAVGHRLGSGVMGVSGIVCGLSAWRSWVDRMLSWSRKALIAKTLQKSLGS